VNEDPDRTIDGRSEWMCSLCRRTERARPVTQDAVQRAIAMRRISAADGMR
jgi:hypothetical protein